MKPVFCAALLILGLTGCATFPAADTEVDTHTPAGRQLGEAQSGETFTVDVGQTVVVRLQSNRTTGYQWVQTEPMRGGVLRDASPAYETPPAPEDGSPRPAGTGGIEVFSFTAARPGTQILNFEYRRVWETGQPAARHVRYTVIVD